MNRHLVAVVLTVAVVGIVVLLGPVALAWGSQSGDGGQRTAVFGGEDAEPGAWPWQVALVVRENEGDEDRFQCGGTLIDDEWVLTAAHCTQRRDQGAGTLPAANIDVIVGMHSTVEEDGEVVRVAQVVPHPQFGEMLGFDNDIALLRLAQPVSFTERVQPVAMLEDARDPAAAPGQHGTITGWGQTDPDVHELAPVLQQAQVPIADCQQVGLPVETVVCISGSEGTNTCSGDSGGPLVVETDDGWRQAGITSAGLMGQCGQPNSITFLTGVAHFSEWVQRVISDTWPMMERAVTAPLTISVAAAFDYELTVTNTGRSRASELIVTNTIPDGVEFVTGSVSPTNGVVQWEIDAIEPGGVFTASYRVREVGSAVSLHERANSLAGLPSTSLARPDVIGGHDAAEGAWPWHSVIFVTNLGSKQYGCGGSLIDDKWVMTAAHCLQNQMTGQPLLPSEVEVRLGSVRLDDPSMQVRGANALYTNGGWHVGMYTDIGLIELDRPVEFSPTVRPVALTGIDDNDFLGGDSWGTVTGFGMTSMDDREPPEVLQQVDLEILEAEECLEHAMTGREICAGPEEGGRSACFGDSGGPFVVEQDGRYVQIGIVSAGSARTCGAPGAYSLFTRVSLYHDWIAHKLATGTHDKVIVNDDIAFGGGTSLIEAAMSPARTLVEVEFDGPLPTPWPPNKREQAIYLPYAFGGS